jgi:Fe-S-cluster containining protein
MDVPFITKEQKQLCMQAVTAIYADLDNAMPERNCTFQTRCCRFHETGLTPLLTFGEAVYAVHKWRAAGRKVIPDKPQGTCPFLDDAKGRCMNYEGRPLGCRTYFCKAAGGTIGRREVLPFIRQLEALSAQMGEREGLDLPFAVQRVARSLR